MEFQNFKIEFRLLFQVLSSNFLFPTFEYKFSFQVLSSDFCSKLRVQIFVAKFTYKFLSQVYVYIFVPSFEFSSVLVQAWSQVV